MKRNSNTKYYYDPDASSELSKVTSDRVTRLSELTPPRSTVPSSTEKDCQQAKFQPKGEEALFLLHEKRGIDNDPYQDSTTSVTASSISSPLTRSASPQLAIPLPEHGENQSRHNIFQTYNQAFDDETNTERDKLMMTHSPLPLLATPPIFQTYNQDFDDETNADRDELMTHSPLPLLATPLPEHGEEKSRHHKDDSHNIFQTCNKDKTNAERDKLMLTHSPLPLLATPPIFQTYNQDFDDKTNADRDELMTHSPLPLLATPLPEHGKEKGCHHKDDSHNIFQTCNKDKTNAERDKLMRQFMLKSGDAGFHDEEEYYAAIEQFERVSEEIDKIMQDRKNLKKLVEQKKHSLSSSGQKAIREECKFTFGPQYDTDSIQTGSGPKSPLIDVREMLISNWKEQWSWHHQLLKSPCPFCQPISKQSGSA